MDLGSNKYFCVTQPTVSRCLKEITDTLNQPAVFNRFVKFPHTMEEMVNIRANFTKDMGFLEY